MIGILRHDHMCAARWRRPAHAGSAAPASAPASWPRTWRTSRPAAHGAPPRSGRARTPGPRSRPRRPCAGDRCRSVAQCRRPARASPSCAADARAAGDGASSRELRARCSIGLTAPAWQRARPEPRRSRSPRASAPAARSRARCAPTMAPNVIRFRRASSNFSFSASSVLATRPALAARARPRASCRRASAHRCRREDRRRCHAPRLSASAQPRRVTSSRSTIIPRPSAATCVWEMRQSMPSSNIDSCAGVSVIVAFLGDRPREAALLQPLGEQAEALAVPVQNFDQVASACRGTRTGGPRTDPASAPPAPASTGCRSRCRMSVGATSPDRCARRRAS